MNSIVDSVLSMNLDVYRQSEIQDTDTGAIVREWNFDLLNPELSIADDAYENEDVMETAIKLVALRNGVPLSEIEKWDLY